MVNERLGDTISRILVTAYGHTADTLPSGPCLAALRSVYPSAEIHMLVVAEVADLWRACSYVDRVLVMRDFRLKGTRLARVERLARLALLTARIRGRYDLVIVLHARTSFFTRLAYLSGARYRAGSIGDCPPDWLTHPAAPSRGIVSFREENRSVLAAIGIGDVSKRLEIWPTAAAKDEADRALHGVDMTRPLICVHPGSHWACQRWHNERWATVADTLVRESGATIVITGSADERDLAREIAVNMQARPVIAVGKTSLLGFAELVSRCNVLICVNSAASQVGMAVGTPVVNLIGLESLAWTGPETGDLMSVVQQTPSSTEPWCPLGVWGRLSHCQRPDHVALAGLETILPEHVISSALQYVSGDSALVGATG